ncbi:DUF1963 domain-containing protein [Novosphingobium sp. Leaf2]|uniref:DUF1963 domain-containing protein n=1 Tax=Novosphingobium sp. Leaf2 TaxID=1735670 RepID=UPI0006FBD2B4|nr:DUF1963 domain-containing protein [Novosphingobium sp. Leaf2]KQM22263.1 hypothetical protein ASE49_02960 [Novosphingobium sp. Leaf2]
MTRLIAALIAFAVPAALAVYLLIAPLGGGWQMLDGLAAGILATLGTVGGVATLVVLGIALALIAMLIAGRGGARDPLLLDASQEVPFEADDTAPPLPWTPEPEAPAPLPPPGAVLLARKPRERARDWFGDTSWFGGLPRLGPQPWPCDDAGTPLPFVAQIDLADLARAQPASPLPSSGSLAFFLGTGAVVAVPPGSHDFADPPYGLPAAYDEGGTVLPVRPGRSSRWFFPFWPVDLIAQDAFGNHAAARDHPFYAAGVGEPVQALWWHGVFHLADRLHDALDDSDRPLALYQEAIVRQHATLARLRLDPQAQPYAAEDAQEELDALEADLETLRAQCAALPDMVLAVDGFVAGRDPWTALLPEERDVVADLLSEIHEQYGELVRSHVPGTIAQLATLSLRVMMSGPPDVFAAMPTDMLLRINREYLLPPAIPHRLFGLAEGDDLLLLELGYDDMMEWNWSENGAFRFTIDARAAAAGHWSAARLAFVEDPAIAG